MRGEGGNGEGMEIKRDEGGGCMGMETERGDEEGGGRDMEVREWGEIGVREIDGRLKDRTGGWGEKLRDRKGRGSGHER
jgi:hypothetical protein